MKKNQGNGFIEVNEDFKQTILEKQRVDFIDKFGREPGPSDPVFFDPTSSIPKSLSKDKLEDLYYDSMLGTTNAFSDEDN